MTDISRERKKELKLEYRQRKPDMGILSVTCTPTGEKFYGICGDYQAEVNSNMAKLSGGMHPSDKLLALYTKYGKEAFVWQLSERLDYIDGRDDYRDDLVTLLQLILEEDSNAGVIKK